MKIFLDTSSLFKLYHVEDGTQELMELFKSNSIQTVFLAAIPATIEFDSIVWKKFRKREMDETRVRTLIKTFEKDSQKFTYIQDDSELNQSAKKMISKYGADGLRTLDSIQLASALTVSETANLFITSDLLLNRFFRSENLKTMS